MDVWQPTPAEAGDPQSAGDGRGRHAEHLRRPDRVDAPQPVAARQRGAEPASAQRSRHRRRGRRASGHGRRGSHRRLPVRQRRAHGQRVHGDAGAEPVFAGHQPGARLLGHGIDHPHRRILHRSAGASAPSVCRRAGVHGVLGIAPGRDQEGLRGAARSRRRRGANSGRCRICRSIQPTWAAPTRPSSASTASRARAASRSCSSATTGCRCRACCRSNSAR